MNTLEAKLVTPQSNAKWPENKELTATYHAVAYSNGEFYRPVTVRCWMARGPNASVVYASIWVFPKSGLLEFSGRGRAGGYGYHKESAAIGDAITSAGIELYGTAYHGEAVDFKRRARINGVGDSAVAAALEAITRACGFRKFTIV